MKALRRPSREQARPRLRGMPPSRKQHDLVLVSGVGSVWPLLRSHSSAEQPPPGHGRDAAGDVLSGAIRRAVASAVRQAEKQQLLPGLQARSVRRQHMLIKNLFERTSSGSINGVVKADQLDDSSVWQELDEFVITKELDQHFRKFFSCVPRSRRPSRTNPDMTGKMGVWISGFFGSGKSHFLKVLSYLLQNRHAHARRPDQAGRRVLREQGQGRHAVRRHQASRRRPRPMSSSSTSTARPTTAGRAGRHPGVFLKVLNEMQGYSGDHPHIAHMERYLDGKGKLRQFHDAYRTASPALNGYSERDVYEFNRDQVVKALGETLGQSEESAREVDRQRRRATSR